MPQPKGAWAKGGLRYSQLEEKVEELLPGARWWFVGINGTVGARVMQMGLMFSAEQVYAVSEHELHVIPLSTAQAGSNKVTTGDVRSFPLDAVDVKFEEATARLFIGDVRTEIAANHEYEALQFANLCGATLPAWFRPASGSTTEHR